MAPGIFLVGVGDQLRVLQRLCSRTFLYDMGFVEIQQA
jgi:hypothetical protein